MNIDKKLRTIHPWYQCPNKIMHMYYMYKKEEENK